MDNKRRSDAWDAKLSEDERWVAYTHSHGVPWYEFKAWIQAEYGMEVSRTAIYNWMACMRRAEAVHRLEKALAARREIKALADAGEIEASTASAYMALANDAILGGNPDKAVKIVSAAVAINSASLRIKEQKATSERIDLQRQELALKRDKFEAAERRLDEAKGVACDESLSESARLKKMKAIFGI